MNGLGHKEFPVNILVGSNKYSAGGTRVSVLQSAIFSQATFTKDYEETGNSRKYGIKTMSSE